MPYFFDKVSHVNGIPWERQQDGKGTDMAIMDKWLYYFILNQKKFTTLMD